ncbi:ribonuclease P protein subunit p14-like isoform X2 [Liolophura sinensis]|uniref:ribonuclease P protein subunit p14-like isoform X2 n=1 Tax=Liolophura sinensis TaxID=3198878 RepID=UPI0031589668
MYKRVVINKPDFTYLKTKLDFEENTENFTIDAILFKYVVKQAVGFVFGEVGGSLNVDVLKYSIKEREAILRVRTSAAVQLQSALSLYSSYKGKLCAFHTLQVSPHLISLAVNSRHIDV